MYICVRCPDNITESNDSDTEVDASGVSSLHDISELRRLAKNVGLARSGSSSSSSSDSPKKKKKMTKKKRKASTPLDSDSDDDSDVAPKSRKNPTKKLRIHSASSIDNMSLEQVLSMKGLEAELRKEQKSELPGISLAREDDEISPIRFGKATDNGRNKLHEARWLRLPVADIHVWWPLLPAKRTDIICNMDSSRFGTACNVASFTIRVRHDRRYKGLQVIPVLF